HLGRDQLLEQGLPVDAVEKTIRLVDLAEYKRRQAPPGIKVTERAFDRDRRMPITNRFGGSACARRPRARECAFARSRGPRCSPLRADIGSAAAARYRAWRLRRRVATVWR